MGFLVPEGSDDGGVGPDPSAGAIADGIKRGVKGYARTGGPLVPEVEIDAAIMRVAQRRTAAELKADYEANPDTNAYTDAEKAEVATLSSPIRAVGLLQWAVTPTLLEGRAAADIERTFRLEFELPHLPLSHLYVEIWIENRMVHARRQWSDAGHLDVAVSDIHAAAIAGALAAARTSLNLELRFFAGAAGGDAVAATARRVQIVEDDGSSQGGDGQTEAQVKALIRAGVLDQAETGNADRWKKSKMPADTVYDADLASVARSAIGRIDVNPGRIGAAADLDGTYQCIVSLTDSEVSALTAASVNYLEIWFGTETVHVVSPWAPALASRIDAVVDTSEEREIGAAGTALPVRAVYRINQGGSQEFFAEGAGALRIGGHSDTDAGDTWNAVDASSAGGLNSKLVAHRLNDDAMLVTITDGFATAIRTYVSGQRWYLAPHQSSERFMVLVSEDHPLTTAQQIAQLTLLPDPGSISFTSQTDLAGKVKTVRIGIPNPELLTGNVWVEGAIEGQPGLARTKWATNIAALAITLTDLNASAVATAAIAGDDPHLDVRLRFYDAAMDGNEIERVGVNIPLVDLRTYEVDNSREANYQGLKLWYGTKAQFDALQAKDASTIYYYPPA